MSKIIGDGVTLVNVKNKQDKITANGVLKGDGNGNITAAEEAAVSLVEITKDTVGLGNVDNTSDANKPVSTATQTALDDKLSLSGGTMTGGITFSNANTETQYIAKCSDSGIFEIVGSNGGGMLTLRPQVGIFGTSETQNIVVTEGSTQISKLSDPVDSKDAANKAYVDTKQDKITASGVLKGDGEGNITAVDGDFVVYEPIADVEATTTIDADTLNGKTYDNIKDYVDKRALGTNIFDDWYFGNPVNQRDGYIIPTGTQIYSDSGLTSIIGGAAYACPVVELTSTYAKVQDTNGSSSYYYTAASDAVRGYIGIKYGIDRWKMWQEGGIIIVENGGIVLQKISGDYIQWGQILEENVWNALVGQTVTISALTADGQLATTTQTFTSDGIVQAVAFEGMTFHSTSTLHLIDFVLTGTQSPVLKAVKLELGSEQTLAHQDASGNWVLNEIPNYNTELLKCQRYFQVIASPSTYATSANSVAIGYANNTVDFWVDFNLSVPMRTSPTASIPDITLFKAGQTSGAQKDITKAVGGWAIKNNDSCTVRSLIFTSSGLTAGANYILFMHGGAKILLSADL